MPVHTSADFQPSCCYPWGGGWRRFVAGVTVGLCFWSTLEPRYAQAQIAPASVAGSPTKTLRTSRDMSARVDVLLDEHLREIGWPAAGWCSDAAFLRRASLDLTGTPPSASTVVDFLQDTSNDKRDALVERLLDSPGAADHLAKTWSGWMLPEEASQFQQAGQGLQEWLRNRFAENLRYDRLVSDLLIATGPPQSGPTAFFVSLEGKPEKIAAKTSRVFLGLQLDCAECHDHPFDKWTQQDFWGFAAYFAQLSISSDAGMMRGGDVIDVSTGEVVLPGSEESVVPKPLVQTGQTGLTSGTRRQRLTLWLTARENPFVARAAVNRVWSLLFGRGLIEPIDDMRNLEMASHPELLRELSEHFADTGYDLRELFKTLTRTEAYRRATLHESGTPPEASFAAMAAKPLTQSQLTTALALVARQVSSDENEAAQFALANQLGKLRGDSNEAKLGMVSALVTLHGAAFDAVSRNGQSRLLKALQAPYMDRTQQVRWLFLSTLSREPTADEQRAFSDLVAEHAVAANPRETTDGGAAILAAPEGLPNSDASSNDANLSYSDAVWQSDLLWALINSTEFAMTP